MTDQAFRDLMAGACAPVTIVTAAEGGRPQGATVSAFASLSLRPPMVTVALDHRSTLLKCIRRTGRYGVNVLGHGQDDAALAFATRGIDRFAAVEWRFDHGLPRLVHAPGWLVCDLSREVRGGGPLLAARHRRRGRVPARRATRLRAPRVRYPFVLRRPFPPLHHRCHHRVLPLTALPTRRNT